MRGRRRAGGAADAAAARTAARGSPAAAAGAGRRRRRPPRRTPRKYRTWLNQNCVGCHNSRTKPPADDPVNLETASLDDLLPQAPRRGSACSASWPCARCRRRACRIPTSPSTWRSRAGSPARSTARGRARARPGRYVVHRLNRTEYGNAVRDLLALDVDVTQLLPSDGADFGFDNIATALKTSPLLLERYLTAAQRISTLAVGDADVRPGNTEYPISREFTQSGYIEGLPLGTRGGTVIHHVFPADGEYKLSGRLVRGVEEGYAGVEGNDQPHTFVITVDGAEVYSAQIGGQKDHEVQVRDMNEARAIIDARMTGKVNVTAGPHDVGFTWSERPSERQDVWQPARRDSQEVHMIAGLPRLKTVVRRRPVQGHGHQRDAEPREDLRLQARPRPADESGLRAARSSTNLARRAYRRPVTAADVEAPMTFYKQARERGGNFDAGIRVGRRAHPGQPVVPVSRRARPGRRCARAPRTRSATSSSRRGCRSSCGAASRTRSC